MRLFGSKRLTSASCEWFALEPIPKINIFFWLSTLEIDPDQVVCPLPENLIEWIFRLNFLSELIISKTVVGFVNELLSK